jgi:hypothetical protein
MLRLITDVHNPLVKRSADARAAYIEAIQGLITDLHENDFEQLIDLILIRSGWVRKGTLGGNVEGVDLEAECLAISEIAFVQVKSQGGQALLNDYIGRFNSRRDTHG